MLGHLVFTRTSAVRYISTLPREKTDIEQLARLEPIEPEIHEDRSKIRPLLESSTGIPLEQLSRKVKIFLPPRNPTQTMGATPHAWRLQFFPSEKWSNPVMGWTSTRDPVNPIGLDFPSKERAIQYATENGFEYELSDPSLRKVSSRTYADNFRYRPPPKGTNLNQRAE
eukprot:TRINITY_DN2382_c0_g2_i2.p1 TRINITY_DN2382_c0_g2~~TRINITY_DN2382_c0_g2_i2.p1  ORF type:complete len:169 (-),score=19.38 TRINITY_DN2382_c0_g2_i2:74-580(-)